MIRDAEGQASRFTQLLTEYQKAPRVTRDRLYIEAIEEVYGSSSKVLLDSDGSGNLLYLPIDKILENQGRRPAAVNTLPETASTDNSTDTRLEARDTSRERSRR